MMTVTVNISITKMLTICLFLFNAVEGHGFFYTPMIPPALVRPQGHSGYVDGNEGNSVGYTYEKPPYSQQLILEPIPKLQQMQQPQTVYNEPNSFLQPPQKYPLSFNDPKYDWSVQPAIKYALPNIPHPFFHRNPEQMVSVMVPLRLFGIQAFPPFLERLIQRVQTYYSVYNPPDTLTIPGYPGTTPSVPFDSEERPTSSTESPQAPEEEVEEVTERFGGSGSEDETASPKDTTEASTQEPSNETDPITDSSSTITTSGSRSSETTVAPETTKQPEDTETTQKPEATDATTPSSTEASSSSTEESPTSQETTTVTSTQSTTTPVVEESTTEKEAGTTEKSTTEEDTSTTAKPTDEAAVEDINNEPVDS